MVVLARFCRRQRHILATFQKLGGFVGWAVKNGHVLVETQPYLVVLR